MQNSVNAHGECILYFSIAAFHCDYDYFLYYNIKLVSYTHKKSYFIDQEAHAKNCIDHAAMCNIFK